ncbi:Redoxin domain protein [Magnetococcus marinus MC-1]|uniref:Redoxin domain protein n=1 Tax=Magnetococcus marinus (strain ATCC BAA-1437 / JCM 17883 / MC-1) TaxID=156889 RepID=A0L675_MAGMM|nr:thioredoxin family protein [Magnetococcus marinus]ABK43468.1 Redoxin domain protein [Magnetococcus marinus MC-1]
MVLLHTPPGELGAQAAPFELTGTDGKIHRLADYNDAKALVLMFICNHCPYVQAVEERLIRLAEYLATREIAVVAINSNDAIRYPEDRFEKMCQRAAEKRYSFDYLYDESQQVAKDYGAICTPDFFIYDAQRTLRYRGRLDDAPRNPAQVTREELKLAAIAIAEGHNVEVQHPSMGCSIKWKSENC